MAVSAVGVTVSIAVASEGVTAGKEAVATVSSLSDQSWYFSLARNLLRAPQVRHLTTKCSSRAAGSVGRCNLYQVCKLGRQIATA